MKRRYAIVPYDPEWSIRFSALRELLRSIFLSKVVAIEHVGSTAVPGMSGKSLIDVLLTVRDVRDLEGECRQMAAAGYDLARDSIAPDTLLFSRLNGTGEKLENIHVCLEQAPKVRQFIIMRDYLRSFPDKARAYAAVKMQGFRDHPTDYRAYRAAKEPFLRQIEQEAYAWDDARKAG
jgi:GrpB-like predicted nucleotidyltransferase (UPF0157 family)